MTRYKNLKCKVFLLTALSSDKMTWQLRPEVWISKASEAIYAQCNVLTFACILLGCNTTTCALYQSPSDSIVHWSLTSKDRIQQGRLSR